MSARRLDASSPLPAGPAGTAPSPAFEPPPGNPRFELFDGLRGLALLAVLLFHVNEFSARIGLGISGHVIEVLGFPAVITFFVISGFLLYRPGVSARAQGKPLPSLRRYARRRAMRIFPAYWVVLTALAIFPGLVGVFSGQWWRYYGFLQIYSHATQSNGIAVAWTLCVDLTFYISLPVWAMAVRRATSPRSDRQLLRAELVPLTLLAALGCLVQCASASGRISALLGTTLLGQCTWLALGMGLAVLSVVAERDAGLVRWLHRLADRPLLCWAAGAVTVVPLISLQPPAGLLGLIASASATQSSLHTLAKVLLQGALVTLLVLPAVFGDQRRGLPRRLLALRPIAWLGVISYSFYLLHLTIIGFVTASAKSSFRVSGLDLFSHVHTARTWILFLIAVPVTVGLATASYWLIEYPFLRRKEPRRRESAAVRRASGGSGPRS